MLAPVLPFRRRTTPRDWTEQDKAEFYRVVDVLGRAGIPLELETGLTDENEPWAVFCTADAGEPVVHIARLGIHYILAATTLAEPLRGPDLRSLVRAALQDVPAAILPGSSRGVLTLHPAALLLVLVATCWFQSAHAAEPAPEIAAQLLGATPDINNEDVATPAHDLAADPGAQAQEPDGEIAALRFQQNLTVAVALLTVSSDVTELIPPAIEASTLDMAAPHDETGSASDMTQGTKEPVTASRQLNDPKSVLAAEFTSIPEEAPPAPSPMAAVAKLTEDTALAPMQSASREAASNDGAILQGPNGTLIWHGDGVYVQPAEASVLVARWADTPTNTTGQATDLPDGAEAALAKALGHLAAYQSWSLMQTGRAVMPLAELSPEFSEKLTALVISDAGVTPIAQVALALAPDIATAPIEPPGDKSPLVSLMSLAGSTGMREEQVSLDTALAQLRQFTTSTPDHLTILSGNSLILVDPAVLKGGQPHAYSSVTMSDGSELAWIYPVGVVAIPWAL